MRRIMLSLGLVLIGAGMAHAQVALYVTSSSAHLSGVPTGSVATGTGYQEQYTSYWSSGIGGGVTFTFLPLGPVKLGLDLRGSTKPGTTGYDTAMGGIKLGFKAPFIPIKPYLQASGGYVATRTVNVSSSTNQGQTVGGTFNNRYAAWEVLGGIDFSVAPFLDFRVIEVGGGTGVNIPGVTNQQQNLSLFTVNTGLVLHF
jgi:hypothetical protein